VGREKRRLVLEPKHYKAVNQIRVCRTSQLGGIVLACEHCGEAHFLYHSCRHRFCARCGSSATNRWANDTLHSLLNIKHYHIVFTLPAGLRSMSQHNGDMLHNVLFECSAEVIKSWFEYKHGLKCGIISVLHTAGSDLKYHPHIHMIVSSGGMEKTGGIKVVEGQYLTHHKFLARRFRHVFEQKLIKNYDAGTLKTRDDLKERPYFLAFIRRLNKQEWNIGIQEPLAGVENIVRYVGRYTRRACISERRIESIADGRIRFTFNDYKNTPRGQYPPKEGIKELPYEVFLDRLLQHIPTTGYQSVRSYGIYQGRQRKQLPEAYRLPETENAASAAEITLDEGDDFLRPLREKWIKYYGKDLAICLNCGVKMVLLPDLCQSYPQRNKQRNDSS
jgi:hypothetical protein